MSNAPSKPVSFSRPKVGYFSNRPRIIKLVVVLSVVHLFTLYSHTMGITNLEITTEILNDMNNKLLVGGIFCDLEKTIDCVNQDILLSELKLCGISDKDFQLYQSYLGNIYCRTAIHNDSKNSNEVSNWAKDIESHKVLFWDLYFFFYIFINTYPVL